MGTDLTVGQLANAAVVSIETIRYHQRRGLLDEPPKPLSGKLLTGVRLPRSRTSGENFVVFWLHLLKGWSLRDPRGDSPRNLVG